MTNQGKRGRPKGTGINDHDILLKIAHLMAATPNMKRTTAIKQVGITNPSVVRRLRDKYQELEHSLLAEVSAINGKSRITIETTAKAEASKKAKAAQSTATASAPRAAAGQQVREEAIHATSQQKTSSANQGLSADPLAALFEGLTIETLVSQFIGHVLGIESKEIEGSPITALIKQQAQLVDLVLPLLISQFGPQKATRAA